jgi:hypothetical protein
MAVVASQGIFMSTRSRSSATITNIIQPSTVLPAGGYGGHLLLAYVRSGPVSTLVVLTNNKGKLPLKIELL